MGWRKGIVIDCRNFFFAWSSDTIKKLARITMWLMKRVSLHNVGPWSLILILKTINTAIQVTNRRIEAQGYEYFFWRRNCGSNVIGNHEGQTSFEIGCLRKSGRLQNCGHRERTWWWKRSRNNRVLSLLRSNNDEILYKVSES